MKLSVKHSQHLVAPTAALVLMSLWFHEHPHTVRHLLRSSLVVLVLFTMLNAGLFSVQNGRTAAFTTINGKAYGLMPIEDAKKVLKSEYAGVDITVHVDGKTIILDAEKSGITLNANQTFRSFTDKQGWQKIPVVNALGTLFTDVKPAFDINHDTLTKALAPYVNEKVMPAKDATAVVPADTSKAVAITPEVKGHELTAAVAADELATAVRNNEFTTRISGKTLEPKWTTLDLRAFLPVIDAARHTSMTIAAGEQKVELKSEALAPMLRVNTAGSELKMTLDQSSLQAYLDQQSVAFYTAPIATKTVLKDGAEINREEGKPGVKLDSTATAALVVKAFENGVRTVKPTFAAVTPGVLVSRTYSNTSTGLYKIMEDYANGHPGSYHIAAVELNGPGNRSAFYRADDQIIPASTFKAFIAYNVMQKIEQGSLSLDTQTELGTVDWCMHNMIVYSENPCAPVFQNMLGWPELDAKLHADGFPSTFLNNYSGGDKTTTARDEVNLFSKLYFKELINQQSQDYLFGLFKTQIWRKGIPAGSRGATVADKVGYLDGLYHDTAIVYGPKTTYALSIMTDGWAGWSNIRALAEQVYDFYNQ